MYFYILKQYGFHALLFFISLVCLIGYIEIPLLKEEILKNELIKYIDRGNQLRIDFQCISENIHDEAMKDAETPRLFYFIEASTGMGKSQLALSLSMPVIYIPLTTDQAIYECFSAVSQAVHEALSSDYNSLRGDFGSAMRLSSIFRNFDVELMTVGLLLTLFKVVYGKTNQESFKILSGHNGRRKFRYAPMSIVDAKKEIMKLILASRKKYREVPVFFIDEAPSHEESDAYKDCIFLRNIIRCMHCICIMSGTEAAVLNDFEKSGRADVRVDHEYMRFISKLPKTNWDSFCHDSKYAQLMPFLSPDLCNMLRSTRPLFVKYVLDAMLEERFLSTITSTLDSPDSSGELTAAVLSRVKRMVLKRKSFTSLGGLYGQLAVLHPRFISLTVEDLLEAKIGDLDYLQAQMQFCIRNHFGKMHIKDSENSVLSLFLAQNHLYSKIASSEKCKFRPNITFEPPGNDPLLYLICIRDGLYWTDYENKVVRVSSSYALSLIAKDRLIRDMPLFANPRQRSTFHEMEVVFAAIASSHSHQKSVSSCPLGFFLRSIIGELNTSKDYVTFDNINDIPRVLEELRIEVLLPTNVSLQENSDSIFQCQHNDIVLGSCLLSNNSFPLHNPTVSILVGPLESKRKEYDDQMQVLVKTIGNTVPHNRSIKILIVGKFSISLSNNKRFDRVDAVMIRGNACKGREVATELHWKSIRTHQDTKRFMPECTLIVIELDSIYFDRWQRIKFVC